MKSILTLSLIVGTLAFAGCDDRMLQPDYTPPSAPHGLYTFTGDGAVELVWDRNPERDLAGYNIYSSGSYGGKYILIAATTDEYFIDRDVLNGNTYYYAVTAYDFDGNESPLSRDLAYDTPRPEGRGMIIGNYRTDPDIAGYDFSTYTVARYDDPNADMYFEHYQGEDYLVVWDDSDIQDMGFTESLSDIGGAPADGWSPTKDARIVVGHTYIVWTWDNHYAKIRVKYVSSTRLQFDWAYQLQTGNPRLKTGVHKNRTPLETGSGAKQRQ